MNHKTLALALGMAATALTTTAPAIAQARDYRRYSDDCTDRVHGNGTTGLLVGGLAGAAIGANLAAHHGGRTGGALIGAAAGAAVGSNIARSSTKDHCRGPRYRAAYPVYDGYTRGYADPGPYYGGYTVHEDEHHDRGRHLGWYRHREEGEDDDD